LVDLANPHIDEDATRRSRPVRHWPKSGRIYRRRRLRTLLALGSIGVLVWLVVSIGSALTNPALGGSPSARVAAWAREHGGASIVNWAENEWYSHHRPPVGGRPHRASTQTGDMPFTISIISSD
jgi:hypothetical protein